jgi:hypothetical protein
LFKRFPFTPKGSTLSSSPIASLYHFRTRAELDTYLEASQIRERAIERITNVTGTYGLICLWAVFVIHVPNFYAICCGISILSNTWLVPLGRYNDLRLRIFSKYPHLFPEEVCKRRFVEYDIFQVLASFAFVL